MAPKKNNNNDNDRNTSSSQNATSSDAAQNNNQQQQQQSKKTTNNKGGSQRIGGDGPRDGPRMSRSKKAGVVFPVLRIQRHLKNGNYAAKVRPGAAVYMAGVLEYLIAEVAELAGNSSRDNKRKRITPRDITLAIRNDEELNQLCGNVTIASGGVIPLLHEVLLQSKKSHSSQSMKGDESINKKKKSTNSKKKQNKKNTEADTTANSANNTEASADEEESAME